MLRQAQIDLIEAREYVYELEQKLETLQAELEAHHDGQEGIRDTQGTQALIHALEAELQDYQHNVLPALNTAVSKAHAQQVIHQLSDDDTPLLTADQARDKTAQVALAIRQQLQTARQELEHNAQQVTDLVNTLQQDPGAHDDEQISFPAPGQVSIHGRTYDTTGAEDLYFMAHRAFTQVFTDQLTD